MDALHRIARAFNNFHATNLRKNFGTQNIFLYKGHFSPFYFMEIPPYTPNEEQANFWTHFVPALIALPATLVLLYVHYDASDAFFLFGIALFGITAFLTFSASSAYHRSTHLPTKKHLRLLDHLAIYALIAGSYSPFVLGNLRHDRGYFIFALVWLIAFVGISFKIAVRNNFERYERIDPFLYVVLASPVFFFLDALHASVAVKGIWWLTVGGAFYVSGIAFFQWSSLPYHHAIWHLFVIAGASMHFYAVLHYAHLPA